MSLKCLLFGHKPQFVVGRRPAYTNCMRCPMITFQEWYPSIRRGWFKSLGDYLAKNGRNWK